MNMPVRFLKRPLVGLGALCCAGLAGPGTAMAGLGHHQKAQVAYGYVAAPVAVNYPGAYVATYPTATYGTVNPVPVSPQMGFGVAAPMQMQMPMQMPMQTVGYAQVPMMTTYVPTATGGGTLPVSPNLGSFGTNLSALSSFSDGTSAPNAGFVGAGGLSDDLLLRSDPQYRMLSQVMGENQVRELKNELRAHLYAGLHNNANRGFPEWGRFLFDLAQRFFMRKFGGIITDKNLADLIDRLIRDLLREGGVQEDSRPNDDPGTLPAGRSFRITGTIQVLDGNVTPVDPITPPGPNPPSNETIVEPDDRDRDTPAPGGDF